MNEQTETTYTATFDPTSQEWNWDKQYEYGPQPGSPVDILQQKIKANEYLNQDEFFTYLFMLRNMASQYARDVIDWIINQGDITIDSKLTLAAWNGLYYAYEHEHNNVEYVHQKEYEIITAMRQAWRKL